MKCAHKTSLPRHFLFKCVYQVIYVLVVSNLPLSTILIFDFGTVPKVWYFPPSFYLLLFFSQILGIGTITFAFLVCHEICFQCVR
jgi:hypothetical protein